MIIKKNSSNNAVRTIAQTVTGHCRNRIKSDDFLVSLKYENENSTYKSFNKRIRF